MYKKVYVEITNNCNLNCDFCPHNKREHKFMKFDEFKTILNKLENHTKYLYFHILGEPLLHPNINEFIDYASSKFNINITIEVFELFQFGFSILQFLLSNEQNLVHIFKFFQFIIQIIQNSIH